MTSTKDKPATAAIKDLLSQSPDGLREIVRAVMQEVLEAEMVLGVLCSAIERLDSSSGLRKRTRRWRRRGGIDRKPT